MRKPVTEFVGTFFLVLTICLASRLAGSFAPLAIGLMLTALVYMGGPISGAQYNPAVSLAVFLTRHMSAKDFVIYVVAQLLGAMAAAGVGFVILGSTVAPAPGPTYTNLMALLVEILFTFALVLVVLNVACVKKVEGNSYFGLAIGLTVLAAALAGGSVSGGAFNPAVGIGLCSVQRLIDAKPFAHVWIYILGPLVGAILATGVFKIQHPAQATASA